MSLGGYHLPNDIWWEVFRQLLRLVDEKDEEMLDETVEKMEEESVYWCVLRSVCKEWRDMADQLFDYETAKVMVVSASSNKIESLKLCLAHRHTPITIQSALELATTNGHADAVNVIIQHGADPSADDNFCIKYAAAYGHIDVVRILLEDPRVDPSAENGLPLERAMVSQDTRLVMLFLKYIQPDWSEQQANRIMWCAAASGHTDMIRYLLDNTKVNPAASDNQALKFCVANGHVEATKLLLSDPRVDPSDGNFVPKYVASSGSPELLELIIRDERVDPTQDESAVLTVAIVKEQTENVRVLLKDGRVDPSFHQNWAIRAVCSSVTAPLELVDLLLKDPRVDPSAVGNEALLQASLAGNESIVNRLLQDERVRRGGKLGDAILSAAIGGHQKVIESLMPYAETVAISAPEAV
ncbi:ankyrin repeat domain-containing protein 44 [Planoprotostelium fungivorum]|uniref:Ankyrin repeat domain-containing protein 44 n=1 Tax=Planoprotostelium fungivorum TaxID=1890364 RepID=A0A2P6N164_9EUKA|nr:ankyrin repeat domain-containing protein 44 [Planoprotostelium fungivorum]